MIDPRGSVGIVNGTLGLWDRFAKNRPEAWILARGYMSSAPREPYLVIRNRSRFPIRIRSISVEPDFAVIMGGDTIKDAAKAMGGSFSATIDAENEKDFPLILRHVSDENQKLPFRIKIRWRSMRRPEKPCLPVVYRTTVENVRDLLRR